MHGGETTVVLRFLDFLTGEDHPLAAIPVLTIVIQIIYDHTLGVQAEILDDIVLVHVHQGYSSNHGIRLCRWCLVEWKIGRVVRVSVRDLQQSFQYSS
jgi:hypothetical protein